MFSDRHLTVVGESGRTNANMIRQQSVAARSLRDRLRSLFNGRPVGKINRCSTSLAWFTAATATLTVVRTRVGFVLKRNLPPTAMFLPVAAMVAASPWFVEPILMQILGVVLCVCVFIAILFALTLRMSLVGTTVIAIVLSIVLTNWPMRAAFAISRPTFDQIANDVRMGNELDTPFWAGLFRIRKAEVYYNNVVCLWTHQNPAGKSGFVQCPPENPPFNLWSHITLDASWQFITED